MAENGDFDADNSDFNLYIMNSSQQVIEDKISEVEEDYDKNEESSTEFQNTYKNDPKLILEDVSETKPETFDFTVPFGGINTGSGRHSDWFDKEEQSYRERIMKAAMGGSDNKFINESDVYEENKENEFVTNYEKLSINAVENVIVNEVQISPINAAKYAVVKKQALPISLVEKVNVKKVKKLPSNVAKPAVVNKDEKFPTNVPKPAVVNKDKKFPTNVPKPAVGNKDKNVTIQTVKTTVFKDRKPPPNVVKTAVTNKNQTLPVNAVPHAPLNNVNNQRAILANNNRNVVVSGYIPVKSTKKKTIPISPNLHTKKRADDKSKLIALQTLANSKPKLVQWQN